MIWLNTLILVGIGESRSSKDSPERKPPRGDSQPRVCLVPAGQAHPLCCYAIPVTELGAEVCVPVLMLPGKQLRLPERPRKFRDRVFGVHGRTFHSLGCG